MFTIFCFFCQFSAKKSLFLQNYRLFKQKKSTFFCNFFKNKTSVPGVPGCIQLCQKRIRVIREVGLSDLKPVVGVVVLDLQHVVVDGEEVAGRRHPGVDLVNQFRP
jgi:hypothetical protein